MSRKMGELIGRRVILYVSKSSRRAPDPMDFICESIVCTAWLIHSPRDQILPFLAMR